MDKNLIEEKNFPFEVYGILKTKTITKRTGRFLYEENKDCFLGDFRTEDEAIKYMKELKEQNKYDSYYCKVKII